MTRRRLSSGRISLGAAAIVLTGSVVGLAQREGPVLHVRFDPNPAEDLRLGARVADGRIPAALDTASGMVSAPGDRPGRASSVYGGLTAGQGVDAAYQIDRLTTQPDVVRYDDPFAPSVAPYKRLFAFDRVGPQLELAVARTDLEPVSVGGNVQAGEDAFYGDIQVDLVADVPVRIPTVAAGARLIALHADPGVGVEVMTDGAGNWFAVGRTTARVRLLMQLSVPRAVFGSAFAPIRWTDLARYQPAIPPRVQAAADRVLAHIGVSQANAPYEALTELVRYFRGFAPSSDIPQAATTEGLYEELALSRKGVCRHRSYAFLITAQRLGLPTRFVHNEAHAWVEVFDTRHWHRIDLGGAAGRMEYERPPDVPLHRPPRDQLPWPADASPATVAPGIQSSADHRPPSPSSDPGASNSSPTSSPSDSATDGPGADGQTTGDATRRAPDFDSMSDPATIAPPDSRGAQRIDAPPSQVILELGHQEIRRGHPLRVSGHLGSEGKRCPFGRVDFALRTESGRAIPLGSLPTDGQGVYGGEVVIPLDVPVGEHDIVVTSPGAPGCGPSGSEN